MSNREHIEFEASSGNIFEDLGFDTAAATALTRKADLVGILFREQQERAMSQAEFGRLVGIPQARLSNLYNGRMAGMSTDKLLDAVARIGAHVTIRVETHPRIASNAGRVELELA